MNGRQKARTREFDRLFHPESIAVIGASPNSERLGHVVLRNLITSGYRGRILPVNPAGADVLGHRGYTSPATLPSPSDCAMIVIPAAAAVEAARDCVAAGIRNLVIGAAGFSETGTNEGRALQNALTLLARDSGASIIGPNTNGIFNGAASLSLGYNAEHGEPIVPGRISVVAHSGAVFGGTARVIRRFGQGLAKFIPVGNEADITLLELLEYLADDPETAVIGLIVEGIDDGVRLRAAAERARAAGKPIVALKVGRTPAGAGAALAHSSRLAGEAAAYDALFSACGIAPATSVEGLAAACAMLADQPPRIGDDSRIIGITTSGAGGALLADIATGNGLVLAGTAQGEWTGEAGRRIAAIKASGQLRNPVDIGPLGPDWGRINEVFEVLEAECVGGPVAVYAHIAATDQMTNALLRALDERKRRSGQPVVLIAPGGLGAETDAHYAAAGIQVFDSIHFGMSTLATLVAACRPVPAASEKSKFLPKGLQESVHQAVRSAAGREMLTELESAELLSLVGVPMVKTVRTSGRDDAVQAATSLGYPVVIKAVPANISHKAAAGLVKVALADATAVSSAWEDIRSDLARVNAPEAPIIVQPMVRGDYELFLGFDHKEGLGDFLLFGLGGVLAEILQDVTLVALPVARETLGQVLRDSRTGRLLLGGQADEPTLSYAAFEDALWRLCVFVQASSGVFSSIDINPLIIHHQGCTAVDGLMVLKSSKACWIDRCDAKI